MQGWEFTYVDLWVGEAGRGHDYHPSGLKSLWKTQEEIARLGREGWEPVGELCFAYGNVQTTAVRQLMLKRPLAS